MTIGTGQLGLVSGLRPFPALLAESAWDKRVVVEVCPSTIVNNWALHSGATYARSLRQVFDGKLMAVTAVRTGSGILVRTETLADCIATAGTFFWDPEQGLGTAARYDDGVTDWDDGITDWDTSPKLYVHLPNNVDPNSTTVAACFTLYWALQGDVIPDLGPSKRPNGGFETWPGGVPAPWATMTNSAVVTVTPDATMLTEGLLSARIHSPGGPAGKWDDGTTDWDNAVGIKWDVVLNPRGNLTVQQTLRAGHYYRLSGSYRTEIENSADFHAWLRAGIPGLSQFVSADGVTFAASYLQLSDTKGEWRRFVLDFLAWADSEAGEVTLSGWNGDTGSTSVGTVHFDEVRLRHLWRWVYAEPRLEDGAIPQSSMASRDIFFGGKVTGEGRLAGITADGLMDKILATLDWENCDVQAKEGGIFADGEVLLYDAYRPAFSGVVDTKEWDDLRVSLDLWDARERFNIPVPPDTYTEAEFGNLAPGYSGAAKRLLFGPKTGISPVPIILTANGYRTYEIAHTLGTPQGISAVTAVYSYKDAQSADDRVTSERITLAAGVDYSVDLAGGRITILNDVRLYEVTGESNKLDFNDGSVRVATLALGLYTAPQLAAEIQTRMRAVGAADLTCTYSNSTHLFTVGKGAGSLSLLLSSGANKDFAVWTLIGFTASGADKTASLSYPGDVVTFASADQENIIRLDAHGFLDDAAGTYTGTPNAPIELGPDIVRYLASVPVMRPEAVDDPTFTAARTTAPQVLGVYLRDQVNIRDVLDRVEYSCGADIVVDGDGLIYFTVGDATVPPNVIDLFDRDFLEYRMGSTVRDLHRMVVVEYDEDPVTGNPKSRSATTASVAVRYGRPDSRSFPTYLTDVNDAIARATAIAAQAAVARRTAGVTVKGKLSAARVGTKVRLTRARGVDPSGSLSAVLFRVLSIDKTHAESAATAALVEV